MQTFSGWNYLLIDAANQYGLDKLLFEERIDWATNYLDNLEELTQDADEPALFAKACLAIRKAQAGEPSGHLVGLDAVCSGMQIMSAITGCETGCQATGLIDTGTRPDAYSRTTDEINRLLGQQNAYPRKTVKDAVMTMLYGSKKEPKKAFGEATAELNAFYEAVYTVAPGACELLQDLIDSWRPYALSHNWQLPDGFEARVKVRSKTMARIEVDELDRASFTYEYYENEGQQRGLSNAANVIHSIDAYILRCLIRRCNYDPEMVRGAYDILTNEVLYRALEGVSGARHGSHSKDVYYYQTQYNRSAMPDVVVLEYLDTTTVGQLGQEHLEALIRLCGDMLAYKPFSVVSIHDDFKCHPNHMNHLRRQYTNIFADLAASRILDDLLTQIYQASGAFENKSSTLSSKIAQSNYALS